jgi:uncharacterized protein (DUF58 family)
MRQKLRERLADPIHRAMWKHFSTSIGLLSIAMMAALYSSSAGRDGRLASAGVAALIALGIAIWVGIRFVPRLAANVEWDWLPFFSQYKVTKEGWIYFFAVTVVVFAAINTSNNLLYMVLSALLAVLLLSGFLSAINFRFVRIEARIPARCFAGEPFPVSFLIENKKRVFPTFSLHLEPFDANAFRFSTFYTAAVRADRHAVRSGEAMISRRGRYVMEKVKVVSRYPFGFFEKYRNYSVDAECICYPEIIPQDRTDFSVLDMQGSSERFERGLGYDLYTIRDYVPSDSTRHIHWKASAKTAVLKTREYAAEESRRVVLAMDRFGALEDFDRFEKLVSHTASLAYHLINDGVEVAFISDDWQTGYGSSQSVLDAILQYLALVKMTPAAAPAAKYATDGAVILSLR